MTSLTRRYSFSASHRLHSAELSAAENTRLFGKCNNPFGHGHDYVLEVTVAGDPDVVSGYINLDVAQFAQLVPTTENVTKVAADLLARDWREYIGEGMARLEKVRIEETGRNSCEIYV